MDEMNVANNPSPEVKVEKSCDSCGCESKDVKKIKNLISVVIILAGLFVGSLFVDVAQLVSGQGFSPRKLSKSDVFEHNGKTWVAYSTPLIKTKVVTDESCAACSPDQVLVFLRRMMPTVVAEKVAMDSDEGKQLIEKFKLKTVPAFVFSSEVKEVDLYSQATQLFNEKDGQLALDVVQMGAPAGKYLSLPQVTESDIVVGSRDAKVKVVEFSDFQCPYCKTFHAEVKKMIAEYGDKVAFVYKHLPLNFHPQAVNAAMAGSCSNEQGKFMAYADLLFSKQEEWGKTTGVQSFKNYARQVGLNASQFNDCMDSKKYADKITSDENEAKEFGISGTPGTFINDQFKGGLVQFAEMKSIIDSELAK